LPHHSLPIYFMALLIRICFIGLVLLQSCGQGDKAAQKATNAKAKAPKIVTLGGTITETVFALGVGSQVAAVDISSYFPNEATKLPQLGYVRTLNAEGVLSQKPDIILASSEAGPPEVVEQLKKSAQFFLIDQVPTVEGTKKMIADLAEKLGKQQEGEALLSALQKDLEKATATVERVKSKKVKVVFILARGEGTLMVGGNNTKSSAIIELSGGINAMQGFEGYKPLTAEAMVTANPEVILVTTRSLVSLGGKEAVFKLPGIAQTPAGQSAKLIAVDDLLLLGFGPRLGQAVQELSSQLLIQATP